MHPKKKKNKHNPHGPKCSVYMQCESHMPVLLVNVNNNQIWACYEYSLIMTIKMCTHRLTVCNHSGDVLALILHSHLV